uniref:DUF1618 domain-containing protein n=1 Tax=Oryza punctata TaxID=4537 RepID=A0A0E0JKP1_ORYPU
MGNSGGSIKFVSINTPATDAAAGKALGKPCHDATAAANTTVAVWTLDQGGMCWKKDVEFRLGNLWSQRGYQESGLPRMVPVWPFLRPQVRGTLYFLVPKPMKGPREPHLYHICGLDMCTKKILLSTLPSVRSKMLHPVAFPTNAFRHLDESPLATRQSKGGIGGWGARSPRCTACRGYVRYTSPRSSSSASSRLTFDRALRALPVTQHHRVWPLYLRPAETSIRIYRRFLQFDPSRTDELVELLVSAGRWLEATDHIVSVLNGGSEMDGKDRAVLLKLSTFSPSTPTRWPGSRWNLTRYIIVVLSFLLESTTKSLIPSRCP